MKYGKEHGELVLAAGDGDLDRVNQLISYVQDKERKVYNKMIRIRGICSGNSMYAPFNESEFSQFILGNSDEAFNFAQENGQMDDALKTRLSSINTSMSLYFLGSLIDKAAFLDNAALRFAALEGRIDVVNRLLEIPLVMNHVSARSNNYKVGNAVLILAIEHGQLAVVARLLAIPAVLKYAATDGNIALRKAVSSGDIHMVNRLLEIPKVRHRAAIESDPFLWLAVYKGNPEVVQRLLQILDVSTKININVLLKLNANIGNLAIRNLLLDIPAERNNPEAEPEIVVLKSSPKLRP